jgi:hypothetical protein
MTCVVQANTKKHEISRKDGVQLYKRQRVAAGERDGSLARPPGWSPLLAIADEVIE